VTAEETVKAKWPDATLSFGNAMSPWFCEVRVWADRKMGHVIGSGVGRDWDAGEVLAWEDAARRTGPDRGGER
jgi:hypothetical protein